MAVLDRIRLTGAEHEKRVPKGLFFLLFITHKSTPRLLCRLRNLYVTLLSY